MTRSIIFFLIGSAFIVLVYALWGREHLKAIFPKFFAWIEPGERWLWNKSETILWSRFLMFAGALPPLLDTVGALNIPELMAVLPQKYVPYLSLIFVMCGLVSEILRRYTTKPLSVVELPDKLPPKVEAAVAEAETAKDAAVVVVEKAKAEGKV